MSEIDWDKAPEGATHFWPSHVSFYTKIGDEFYFAGDIEAGRVNSPASWVKSLITRPSPAWSGDGLPPVGVVCEANFVGEWTRFEMRYYGEAYVVFKTAFEVQRTRHDFDTCCVKFRPIRTKEQIVADEREAVVTYMQCIIGGIFDKESIASPHEISEKLYEAGLRLIK